MSTRRFIANAANDTRKFFTSEHVVLMPFTDALKSYSFAKLRADLRAAADVTLLALPQSIAFAAIAGLPIIFGILCAAIAAMVAPLFAGSRHTIPGPTNATAFMLFSFLAVNPALAGRAVELVPILGIMIGLIAVAGSLLRVADFLQYVSRSVLVGYIAGAAVLIIVNQLKPLLGLGPHLAGASSTSFIGEVILLSGALIHTDWLPLSIGLATFALYAVLKKWRPAWPVFALTLLLICSAFSLLLHHGPPVFQQADAFSAFGLNDLIPRFPTIWREGIFDDLSALLGVAFAIAFLASLENTLMSKTLASRTGERADVNQDMFSVGMANLASALGGGMPASSSLTRSMLNFQAGAATRFASLFSGIYTLAIAAAIAAIADRGIPLIRFLPKAALAALIIVIALSLFNPRHIKICLRSTRDDALVLIVTFIATLLAPLHVAIFIGVAISITLFLRKASKPYLIEYEFNEVGELREVGDQRERPIPAISIVHVEGDLFFGAAELFRTQVQRTISDPQLKVIILRLKNARHLDATAVMALEDLTHFMRDRHLHLLVSGATEEVYQVLKNSGVLTTLQAGCDTSLGESNVFLNSPANPNISTRDALKRAQQLLGTDKADIRIFFDPHKKSGD